MDSICLPQHEGCLLVAIEGGVGFAPQLPPPPAELCGGAPPPPAATSLAAARQQQQVQQGEATHLECFAWVVVRAPGGGATSHARTASFPLPAAVAELVLREGLELGDADDRVFGRCMTLHVAAASAAAHMVGAHASCRPLPAASACMPMQAPGPCGPDALFFPDRLHSDLLCACRVKSGQGSGTIGQLTGGLLTRQSYYEHAALCALIPLMNPRLFPGFQLAADVDAAP